MKSLVILMLSTVLLVHARAQEVVDKICGNAAVAVVVFLGVDCPISQKYIPTLNALHEKYATKGVTFHALVPGDIKNSELKRFSRDYALTFTIDADRKFEVARAVSATSTPQVFVFDSFHRVEYHGAIDNWFYGLGGYRHAPTENYLINAIDALLSGRDPEVRETKALGCIIQYPSL